MRPDLVQILVLLGAMIGSLYSESIFRQFPQSVSYYIGYPYQGGFVLRSSGPVYLTQKTFDQGTYRIRTPGLYIVQEDIEFAPRPDNDYWNDPSDLDYPINQYYLGFFAAITVESDNVVLDLNGHTIQMSKEFYLLQRFCNIIELNDRVFVDNEGVQSLNYQEGDKFHPPQKSKGTLPSIVTVQNVEIKNGRLGRSSHSGIHGNGAKGLQITNLQITNFEVAGIQCNGCEDVVISKVEIGPSSQQVPVLATFANARFIIRYTRDLIPNGFSHEGFGELLNTTFATLRRRGTRSVQNIFHELETTVKVYQDFHMGKKPLNRNSQLDVAKKLFDNPTGLPDGGVVYGILINQLGLPNSDQEYRGGKFSESKNIHLDNVHIKDLHAKSLEVPNIQTNDGTFIQGPGRDLFRIFDTTTDEMRVLTSSYYKGDPLHDAYFAFWLLSNEYYTARVFQSDCGNFASNGTIDYKLFSEDTCPINGIKKDLQLTGRDISMLQKRYFGGLVMTQALYDWASEGFSLHQVLETPAPHDVRRSKSMRLGCGTDTMFHDLQGVIGIKIFESHRVTLSNVYLNGLSNSADDSHWVCQRSFELPNGELLQPVNGDLSANGAAVTGIQIVRSQEVNCSNVVIDSLISEEGAAIGVHVQGDMNDQSDYADDKFGIKWKNSRIGRLVAGSGFEAIPLKAENYHMDMGGLKFSNPEDLSNHFHVPKVSINYMFSNTLLKSDPTTGFPVFVTDDSIVVSEYVLQKTSLNTTTKLLDWRLSALNYFGTMFGVKVPSDLSTYGFDDSIPVLETDSAINPILIDPNANYHPTTICFDDARGCTHLQSNSSVIDFAIVLSIGVSGLNLTGTYGGDQGKFGKPGAMVVFGFYSIENLNMPGMPGNGENAEILYFSECPIQFEANGVIDNKPHSLSYYINCGLQSSLFGRGLSTGQYVFERNMDPLTNQTYEWIYNGFPTMIFDDDVTSPESSGVTTTDGIAKDHPNPDLQFVVWADGILPGLTPGQAGEDAFPILTALHWTHEAGIQYLKQWTSLKDDFGIRNLRTSFIKMLRNDFGIDIPDPDEFLELPLHAQIDLGGGNTVLPYVVNELANFRVLTRADYNDLLQNPPEQRVNSRLHEGGFRLLIGRAGMKTKLGFFPFKSMITKGIYVIENEPVQGTNHEMEFQSFVPFHSDTWSSGHIINDVYSPIYGIGRIQLAITMPLPATGGKKGMTLNNRGSLVFDKDTKINSSIKPLKPIL